MRSSLFNRAFVQEGTNPYDTLQWSVRTIQINGDNGTVIDRDVEAPTTWSDTAIRIAASKYFTTEETSIRQMVARVVDTIVDFGKDQGYFSVDEVVADRIVDGITITGPDIVVQAIDDEQVATFKDELTYVLLHQMASPNSPCFVAGTPILMSSGIWKAIEDIQEGDSVVTHKMRSRSVVETYVKHYCGDIVDIDLRGLPKGNIRCTSNHPFFSITADDLIKEVTEPSWRSAGDLRVGDYIAEAVDLTTVHDIDNINVHNFLGDDVIKVIDDLAYSKSIRRVGKGLEPQEWIHTLSAINNIVQVNGELLRFLGYYLSNGDCSVKHGRVRIHFPQSKRMCVDDTVLLVRSIFGVNSNVSSTGDSYGSLWTVTISSKIVARLIDTLLGSTCHNKDIPEWIMQLPPHKQRELIIGIFRGDGCGSQGNRLILRMRNEALVLKSYLLLRRLGHYPTLENGHNTYSITPQGTEYDGIVFSTSVSARNCVDLYNDIFPWNQTNVEQKSCCPRGSLLVGDYFLRRITKHLVSYSEEDVYNLEVEEDHSYSANGVASHNCWFNLGAKGHQPVSSACFVLGVEDTMESIMKLARDTAFIFKNGAGMGCNISTLRGSKENLTSGGVSSGPLSFLRIYDAIGDVVKSGGRARRSATMIEMDADHPDIMDFIDAKLIEENKAHSMIETAKLSKTFESLAGTNLNDAILALVSRYNETKDKETLIAIKFLEQVAQGTVFPKEITDFINSRDWFSFSDNAAYGAISYQNMNVSVSIPDTFMKRVCDKSLDRSWFTIGRRKFTKNPLQSPTRQAEPSPQGYTVWTDPITKKSAVQVSENEFYLTYDVLNVDDVFARLAKSTHYCGDPGVQFIDTINKWSTVKHIGKIRGSNPCFTSDTLVTTSNGKRTIKDLADKNEEFFALSYNSNREKIFKKARAFPTKLVNKYLEITLSNESIISCTPDHRFWVDYKNIRSLPKTRGDYERLMVFGENNNSVIAEWIPAQELLPSDNLLLADGSYVRVSSITDCREQDILVYDLEVEDTHCFFANDVLVHNCSEVFALDNNSCNLSSIRLTKFRMDDGRFNAELFKHVIRVMITAQDILINKSEYPTKEIARNTKELRPLGLGVADLGTLVLQNGFPYDSREGTLLASSIMSLLTATAYEQSILIGTKMGAFTHFNPNVLIEVLDMHYAATNSEHGRAAEEYGYSDQRIVLLQEAERIYLDIIEKIEGGAAVRNSSVTCCAPSGTIGFLMDCGTTGIEPEFSLVKYKKMVGGGTIKSINPAVDSALIRLGYNDVQRNGIIEFVEQNGHIEGTGILKDEHLSVFDTAVPTIENGRCIAPMGHLEMLAAIQPFISMGISKTVNCPKEITEEEISNLYEIAWQLGIKSIAIYRDGSKKIQPLQAVLADIAEEELSLEFWNKKLEDRLSIIRKERKKLPITRQAVIHKFTIDQYEGYIHVGLYDNGKPGEIFITMSKQGSTLSGLLDGFATSISLALQYGVPLEVFADKFIHTRFEPSGWTQNPEIRMAKSILDYIFRWLASQFLPRSVAETYGVKFKEESLVLPEIVDDKIDISELTTTEPISAERSGLTDAPPCHICGSTNVRRSGTCYICEDCSTSIGGCG